MAKQALEGRRINAFAVSPDSLVVVGMDTGDGPEHPLWDERIHLPIDEAMVLSIMKFGVKEPPIVRKNGSIVEVVDGRRRVLHTRVANKRLAEQGEPLIEIPVMVHRGSEEDTEGVAIALNEIRVQDEVFVKAQKAVRMLGRNQGDYASAAIAFGVTTQTIKNWEKLVELSPTVLAAMGRGEITPTAAVKLHGLSKKEQVEAVRALTSNGKATVSEAGRAAKGTKNGGNAGPKAPSKRLARKVLNRADGFDESFIAGVRWMLGEIEASEIEGLQEIVKQAEA
jgi:ParB family chromosome partitioning protein